MTDTAFSLEVNEKHIRIVDAQVQGTKVSIRTLSEQDMPAAFFPDDSEKSTENLAEAISRIYRDLKMTKKLVRIVIPDTFCFAQVMEFARLSEKELLSAVKYQSDQFIPLPLDQVVFDLEIIKENKETKKNSILIVASPKTLVQRVVHALEYAGLTPESLESELSATSRLYSSLVAADQTASTTLMVNLGYSTTSLYLFSLPGGYITEIRTIKTGFSHFLKELMFNIELKEEKAIEVMKTIGFEKDATYDLSSFLGALLREIVGEIQKFIYVSKERYRLPIKNIYLTNYDSHIKSLDKKISELISVPTESFSLAKNIDSNPITQLYSSTLSSFISGIGANHR